MTADTTSVAQDGADQITSFRIDFASRHRISPGSPDMARPVLPDVSRYVAERDDGLPATFVLKSFARHKHDLIAHRLYFLIFKSAEVMRRLKA
jgi:hypothetical protein